MANTRLQFSFGENPIRAINENDQIFFCLADICKALLLANINHVIKQIQVEFKGVTLNVTPLRPRAACRT